MSKLTPMQKLTKILDRCLDNGNFLYKNLTPYEMKLLIELQIFKHLTTFDSKVANVAKELGFEVKLDEQGINYEISV